MMHLEQHNTLTRCRQWLRFSRSYSNHPELGSILFKMGTKSQREAQYAKNNPGMPPMHIGPHTSLGILDHVVTIRGVVDELRVRIEYLSGEIHRGHHQDDKL